ncbi:MAG: ATP-binding protein [Nitrococcus sp.]|nr:ATP-binding protein [Nitrococcus sp.]
MMIERRIKDNIKLALGYQAAVAIIGPRQVGKTTLALEIGDEVGGIYLDLEDRADRDKLADPRLFLERYQDRLVILDEIHRVPDLFQDLRGIIDRGRREGNRTGRFLMLGSASIDLLHRSGETLAGRIAYVNMGPLDILEVPAGAEALNTLWERGGYPDSYLAPDHGRSLAIRKDFIRSYLQRDVGLFGPRLPAETLERLWTMLAHSQGGLLNASRLASGLGISAQTVTRYSDLLADLLLLRRLPPFRANIGKRLVKSPKVYVRDSGLAHALLGIADYNALAGHPVVGASWEGFVIENLLSAAPERTMASFYRTSAGAEIDLMLELPDGRGLWAIEIKRGLSARPGKGFHNAREDLKPKRSFVVYSGEERYPVTGDIEAIGLRAMAKQLALDPNDIL